jgi:release factor glutamine methyltransferase
MQVKAALARAKLSIAPLDARLLLQHVLECSHADLILRENDPITDEKAKLFFELVERRLAQEPVTKILGAREFYGRMFHVTSDVLDPRGDTETIIDLCLEKKAQCVLDLGVGSGAILLTLLAEWPEAEGVGVDISSAALAVAERNAMTLGIHARSDFLQSRWFENLHGNLQGQFDLIVSNPPYIPSADIAGLERDVRDYDPLLALDGGMDGLDCYRAIAGSASHFLGQNGRIVLEIGWGQRDDVVQIFTTQGFRCDAMRADLSGIARALQFVHSDLAS